MKVYRSSANPLLELLAYSFFVFLLLFGFASERPKGTGSTALEAVAGRRGGRGEEEFDFFSSFFAVIPGGGLAECEGGGGKETEKESRFDLFRVGQISVPQFLRVSCPLGSRLPARVSSSERGRGKGRELSEDELGWACVSFGFWCVALVGVRSWRQKEEKKKTFCRAVIYADRPRALVCWDLERRLVVVGAHPAP